jgi:hypothetical protein
MAQQGRDLKIEKSTGVAQLTRVRGNTGYPDPLRNYSP